MSGWWVATRDDAGEPILYRDDNQPGTQETFKGRAMWDVRREAEHRNGAHDYRMDPKCGSCFPEGRTPPGKSLFVHSLDKMGRTARPGTLVHQDPRRPDARPLARTLWLNDGSLWDRAAWAEILGLEPTVQWQTATGKVRVVRPWRDGKKSAWKYLTASAAKSTGARARKYVADLGRRGVSSP